MSNGIGLTSLFFNIPNVNTYVNKTVLHYIVIYIQKMISEGNTHMAETLS